MHRCMRWHQFHHLIAVPVVLTFAFVEDSEEEEEEDDDDDEKIRYEV
jgi:hypothetical protein